MDVRDSAIKRTAGFEAFVEHMYLDTKDKVTVGYGNMLASASAATEVPFKKANGTAPTTQEIEADWTLIKSKEAGKKASFYKQFTKLAIAEADGRADLKGKLKSAAADLEKRFAELDTYPTDAQDALLDIMYNIGLTKFNQANWPKLFTAVKAKKWADAAANCIRPDVQQARNDAIVALFKSAGDAEAFMVAGSEPGSLSALLTDQIRVIEDMVVRQQNRSGLFATGLQSLEIEVSDQRHTMRIKLRTHPEKS